MLTRRDFLRALPVSALVLTGCTGGSTASSGTGALVFSHVYPLDHATQFTADCYEGGYTLLTLADSGAKFLVVPEGADEPEDLPEGRDLFGQLLFGQLLFYKDLRYFSCAANSSFPFPSFLPCFWLLWLGAVLLPRLLLPL